MSDDKRWIVVVPEQAVSAESEVDAVGLVYSLGLARVSAGVTEYPPDVRSLRVRPDAPPPSPVESWPSFKIEPPPVAHYFGSDALRTELAKLQRATLTLGAHVPREFGPLYDAAQDAKAAAFAVGELLRWGERPAPPSPWRPLPDPECPEDEPVWLTSRLQGHVDAEVAIQRRNGSGTLRWYTYGNRDSGEVIAEALAWVPLPEPWRGGR